MSVDKTISPDKGVKLPSDHRMTTKAKGIPFESFLGAGWTLEQMIAHGHVEKVPATPAPARLYDDKGRYLGPMPAAAQPANAPVIATPPATPRPIPVDAATAAVNRCAAELQKLAVDFHEAKLAGDYERQARAYGAFPYELEQYKAAVKIQADLAKFVIKQTDTEIVPPVDWSKCVGDPPPREWLIQDWLSPDSTGLWGPGGAGKTKLLQAVATGLAMQKPYLAAAYTRPLVVVAWLCEDDAAEVWRTQAAINRYFSVSMADLVKAGRLHIVPRKGEDNMLFAAGMRGEAVFTPVFDRLRERLNDLKADVFIGDNSAHLYGAVENDRHQVTRYVNGMAGLVQDRPFAAIHVGHVAKSEGSEFSGSTAWENAIRSRWLLARSLPDEINANEIPDTVYLARRKANHAGLGWQRFKFDKGMFVPEAMQTAAPGDIRARNDAADEALLAAFDKLRVAGLCPTDTKNSSDYLPRRAQEMGFAPGYTLAQLKETMHRLIRDGKLKRDPGAGMYANRSPRAGLVRVSSTK